MANHGTRPTPAQLTSLRAHRAADLARESGRHRHTAERALAGEGLHPLILASLVAAAERLAGRGSVIADAACASPLEPRHAA